MATNFARAHSADIRLPPLEAFVAWAHRILDPATPESERRAIEPRFLALLPAVRALGVFEPFELRDPALRAWPADEMATSTGLV
ncbi:hypothetical protein DVT68_11240 [Dyella solisilvae]|uniref:Uncharacterized protein n=1 Tax=Dyella solisilvae TaxID=1920168 RepID=A0A370K9E9_9GAMM|nr:hypothetical protein [Dyella solisilvae]RDI99271.1 hypothetical protein DVT68_11240 [Dyella solisilvae]